MATQRRDGSGAGKEKTKGTSPSLVVVDCRSMTSKRSPIRPTTAAAAAAADHRHVSDHRQRRVPNYLKPTISSGIDHSNANANATKQQPTTSTAQINHKANFNRRRSFEKPPSPSNHPANLHNKPVTQAHHHVNHGADQRNSRRPSPALRTATPMPRSHKAPNKDTGKSVFSSARPTQKHTKSAGSNKKQTRAAAGAAEKAPAAVCGGPVETVEAPAVETHLQDDQDSVPATNNIEEEVVKADTVSELPAENPVLQEKESVVQDESEINDDVEDVKPNYEPWADLEDVNSAALDVDDDQVEEAEDEVLAEETTGAINSLPKDEEQESESQEEPEPVPKKENPEEAGEDSTEETENPEGDEATAKKDEDASTAEGKQSTVVEESGKEAAAAAATVGQGGKKENQQAYNDVIEETASKLLEKRKNKVKALVGAFETVISLQEPES